ncbi:hypothetical protein [Streptomyces sp. NRRL S-1824]|uniref:hypothetical protein n=1 Tax=Streptomyces sp. NRRL S-1824 TaxID=1463889 RepID=UPI0004C7B565|nr:hypothetical protein [Streptomyces sp. NRRL S-1824]
MQQPLSMDDLKHVRLAAWQARNPFFEQGLVDESYSRTLFCGRGVLLIAHRMAPRPVAAGSRPLRLTTAPVCGLTAKAPRASGNSPVPPAEPVPDGVGRCGLL